MWLYPRHGSTRWGIFVVRGNCPVFPDSSLPRLIAGLFASQNVFLTSITRPMMWTGVFFKSYTCTW